MKYIQAVILAAIAVSSAHGQDSTANKGSEPTAAPIVAIEGEFDVELQKKTKAPTVTKTKAPTDVKTKAPTTPAPVPTTPVPTDVSHDVPKRFLFLLICVLVL